VAALALRNAGYQVRGATLRLWPGDDDRSCCSPAAVARARDTAHALGAPHYTVNDEARFEAAVVTPFVDAYLAGETPNPCIDCNPGRLARLVELADRFGAGWVATGHYARVVRGADGDPRVARGYDRDKDQSYMLWRVPTETLERLLLPLGELTKPEVRAVAKETGLPAADAEESQEVCFAPGDHCEFLASRGAPWRRGEIVDRDGRVLGHHDGAWRFTVGQRRGLGLSGPAPAYVLAVDAHANRVVVGGADELATSTVELRDLVDRGLGAGDGASGLEVQLRYRSRAVGVRRLQRRGADRALVELCEPFSGAAPGQSAVFYRDDVVVGGGILSGLIGALPEASVGCDKVTARAAADGPTDGGDR